MYKQETRRLRSFLWRMRHFLYFFSYIFNKNKEDCIFLINISCFGHFLLRKVQKMDSGRLYYDSIYDLTMTELWICT